MPRSTLASTLCWPAVDTSTRRKHERISTSPAGVHPSSDEVHSTPSRHAAPRSRPAPVSRLRRSGSEADGGETLGTMEGSPPADSPHTTFRSAGVPLIVTTPRAGRARLHVESPSPQLSSYTAYSTSVGVRDCAGAIT